MSTFKSSVSALVLVASLSVTFATHVRAEDSPTGGGRQELKPLETTERSRPKISSDMTRSGTQLATNPLVWVAVAGAI
jgi:hypothetical protein